MNYEKFFELREKAQFVTNEIRREFLKVKDELNFIKNEVFNADIEYLLETHKNNSIDENIDKEYKNALEIVDISENKLNFLKNNYELKNYYALKAQFLRKQSEIIYNYELALSNLRDFNKFFDNNIICYRYENVTLSDIQTLIDLLYRAISKNAKKRLLDEIFVSEYVTIA
jgi:hypothetical protein|nr:MAG TPA: hypothetical protein [Caudoviricetes sp.]